MADTKISDLPAVTDVIGTDEYVLARSAASKKITAADLLVADAVAFTPSGTVAATDVQAAIEEVAAEAGAGGGLTLIQERIVPSGGAATIPFTSIPGTYRHLVLEWLAQTENGSAQNMFVQFNSDTGSNYGWAQGDVIAGGTNSASSQTSSLCGILAATGDTYPSVGRIEVPFYAGTTWKKIFRAFNSGFYSAANRFNVIQGTWDNTSAVTDISLAAASDVKEASVFTLYGIT